MSDTSDSTSETSTDTTTDTTKDETAKPDLEVELNKWKAEARKHEDRAKANAKAAKELETLKASQMTDTDKAINDALAKAKNEWKMESGSKLALTEFKAKASSRMEVQKIDALLSGLNVSAFLDEDGEPNSVAIDSFLDTFAPPKSSSTNFGQGAQGTALPLNSDSLTDMVKSMFMEGNK